MASLLGPRYTHAQVVKKIESSKADLDPSAYDDLINRATVYFQAEDPLRLLE